MVGNPGDRRFIMLGGVLFSVSLCFPVVASVFTHVATYIWVGVLDGILAFAVMLVMIRIATRSRGRIDDHAERVSYRVYRRLVSIPLVLLIAFFVFGDLVKWDVLLIGLAWRMWVLLYILPAALALWGQHAVARTADNDIPREVASL
jgi:hypothetical protein